MMTDISWDAPTLQMLQKVGNKKAENQQGLITAGTIEEGASKFNQTGAKFNYVRDQFGKVLKHQQMKVERTKIAAESASNDHSQRQKELLGMATNTFERDWWWWLKTFVPPFLVVVFLMQFNHYTFNNHTTALLLDSVLLVGIIIVTIGLYFSPKLQQRASASKQKQLQDAADKQSKDAAGMLKQHGDAKSFLYELNRVNKSVDEHDKQQQKLIKKTSQKLSTNQVSQQASSPGNATGAFSDNLVSVANDLVSETKDATQELFNLLTGKSKKIK